MKHKYRKTLSVRLYKELVLSGLALLSVLLLAYEFIGSPTEEQRSAILNFDVVVALIFALDFCIALAKASNKSEYLSKNWHLLIAAIPIIDSWAEILKMLRLFELVRLIRAGEHLDYVIIESRSKNNPGGSGSLARKHK